MHPKIESYLLGSELKYPFSVGVSRSREGRGDLGVAREVDRLVAVQGTVGGITVALRYCNKTMLANESLQIVFFLIF